MAKEKLIETIKRLLALSTSSNKHEAELAMAKASEIMEKHRISLSEVEIVQEVNAPVGKELYSVENLKMKYQWVQTLAKAAAVLFGGEVIGTRSLHGTAFYFVGKPNTLFAAKAMFEYLYKAWGPICAADLEAVKADLILSGQRPSPAFTMKFKVGHGHAFAEALAQRAADIAFQRDSKENSCTAIVLANQAQVTKFMKDNSVMRKTTVSHGSASGRNLGEIAGKRIPLGGLNGPPVRSQHQLA